MEDFEKELVQAIARQKTADIDRREGTQHSSNPAYVAMVAEEIQRERDAAEACRADYEEKRRWRA